MKKLLFLEIISLSIFIVLLFIGFSVAKMKPLWIDEVFSQTSIEKLSYPQIISGSIPEGNNSPLFYIIQKAICNLSGYHLSEGSYEAQIWDPRTMILLRVGPVVCVALALIFLFYFFARHYGTWAGFYGLLTALFSYNVWLYWAEARPYALWFSLTIVQSLLFLNIMRQPGEDKTSWKWLTVVHILLSLTAIFSFSQILAVSLLLWLSKEKDWKQYVWLTLLPCLICIPYYFLATKAKFFFPKTVTQLILPGFPKEWLALLLCYIVFIAGVLLTKNQKALEENTSAIRYLAFTILMFIATAIVLVIFKINAVAEGQGYEISHRYFIYLTAVGAVLTTTIAVHLIRAVDGHRWLLWNMMMGLWAFLIISFLRNGIWAIWFF